VSAERLGAWTAAVLDGFLGGISPDGSFTAEAERPVLVDTVRRLLAP
jgi:hypothetical protein